MTYWLAALSYIVGSFPTAYVAGRLLGRGDIRLQGDGNVGAQNAARLFGLKIGVVVFFIDAAKGALAVALAYSFNAGLSTVLWAGTMSVVGHSWSVFLGFRGGRGESTAIGVLLVLITQPMLIAGTLALATLIRTKNVIKTSFVLLAPLSPLCWFAGLSGQLTAYSVALPAMLGLIYVVKEKQQSARVLAEADLRAEAEEK